MLEKAPITNTLSPDEYRDYDFFPGSFKRKEIFNFTKNTVSFLENLGKPANILFFDRSARMGYAAIDEYWNLKHGTDGLPKPKFYFINPDGFRLKYFVGLPVFDDNKLSEIDDSLDHLDKDQPLVLLDVCIHRGNTIRDVINYLQKVGFKNIKIVVANNNSNDSEFTSEIPSIKDDVCYIFSDSQMEGNIIDKSSDSIFSTKRIKNPKNLTNQMDQSEANAIRKELRQMIRDQF